MIKGKFRWLKQGIALTVTGIILGIFSTRCFGADNLPAMDSVLQSCENSAAGIQKSNEEILQELDLLDAGIDEIRIRIRRSHRPSHP